MAGLLGRITAPPQPASEPGFEGVQRYWDPAIERWTAKILPGEFFITRSKEAISTLLGSCVAACIRDPELRIGGMNHFSLPDECAAGASGGGMVVGGAAAHHGAEAMERLIRALLAVGGRRECLEVKLFGGARVLPGRNDVGNRNIAFASEFLRSAGLQVTAQDVGHVHPRRVLYFPDTGRTLVATLRAVDGIVIGSRDNSYRANLDRTASG